MVDVIEYDGNTGEVVERVFTPDEQAQREADEAAAAQAAADKAAAEAARASARTKIAEASGLTPEEMAALGF